MNIILFIIDLTSAICGLTSGIMIFKYGVPKYSEGDKGFALGIGVPPEVKQAQEKFVDGYMKKGKIGAGLLITSFFLILISISIKFILSTI